MLQTVVQRRAAVNGFDPFGYILAQIQPQVSRSGTAACMHVPQSGNEQLHGYAGLQFERVARHHLRPVEQRIRISLLAAERCPLLNLAIVPPEHQNILRTFAGCQQLFYRAAHIAPQRLLLQLLEQRFGAHRFGRLLVVEGIEPTADVSVLMFVGAVEIAERTFGLVLVVQSRSYRPAVGVGHGHLQVVLLNHMLHNAEVETHHPLAAALVANQRLDVRIKHLAQFALAQTLHDLPVAVAEAVDALLGVTHNQHCLPGHSHHLLDQVQEHVPLQQTGVLKLVNHDMPVAYARLLEDKIRITGLQCFGKRDGCIRQQSGVRALQLPLNTLLQCAHETHVVEVSHRAGGLPPCMAHVVAGALQLRE